MVMTYHRITRDLQRDVHCLFGLPVDNLNLASTKALLRKRVTEEGNTVLSTINVNWVAQSFSDSKFRDAILNSDLVVLDGKPLLWLAKLLGCPMRETVPGSTLIQDLLEAKTEKPLTIFLFGGDGKTAELAMERINQRQGGLRAVGALNPGFGTVEEMSSDTLIASINDAAPDILLVALGAQKGTQWIEHNRHQLNAKIISHLGATINFLAGTVKRAPCILQRSGLEWVWRILQEPKLFTRYATDGLMLLRYLLPRLLPWMRYLMLRRQFLLDEPDTTISVQERPSELLLSFGRNLQFATQHPLRRILSDGMLSAKKLILDFKQTKFADSAFLGMLILLLRREQDKDQKVILKNFKHCQVFQFQLFGL